MKFLKHVGKHKDRSVAIIYREIPGEPHMCLVVYPDILHRHMHDSLMKCIESDRGQQAENLADALNVEYSIDGKIILHALHSEGHLKKVQTADVIVTPMPGSHLKLNELNKLLAEMKQGEDAVKRLAELDASAGLQDPAEIARRMRNQAPATPVPPLSANANDALSDEAIANNLRVQAARMNNEAQSLLNEANRMLAEAEKLLPTPKEKTAKTPKTRTPRKTKAKSE